MSMSSPSHVSSLPSELAAPAGPRPKCRPNLLEDLLVAAFGLLTSMAVAWVSWWLASRWDMAIYTLMLNWVIPAGAIICGMVAATGYWIGARFCNHRPSHTLLFNMVLISIITFFMTHYFHYQNEQVQGVAVSTLVSFPDYLVDVTSNMRYQGTGTGASGTGLGIWGWGVAALQIIGFSVGGWVVYGWLAATPYCDRCSKYLGKKTSRVVKWNDVELMYAVFPIITQMIEQGQLQEAVVAYAALGDGDEGRGNARLTMEVLKCSSCGHRRLRLTAEQHNGADWINVGDAMVETDELLNLRS